MNHTRSASIKLALNRKPILVFLAPDDFILSANLRESEASWLQQQKFRERVRARLFATLSRITDAEDHQIKFFCHFARQCWIAGSAR
jgi:hypothetical protein